MKGSLGSNPSSPMNSLNFICENGVVIPPGHPNYPKHDQESDWKKDLKTPIKGFIYLIKDNQNCYKIGYSTSPADRVNQLQTAHAFDLYLVAVINGTPEAEKRLHTHFEKHRIHPNREWFRYADEILEYFRKNVSQ